MVTSIPLTCFNRCAERFCVLPGLMAPKLSLPGSLCAAAITSCRVLSFESTFTASSISKRAGKYLESGRWIEIAAGLLSIGCRATDYVVVEKEKILDRLGYCIEGSLALPRGQPNFEDAFLARQRYRLAKLRTNCGICCSLGSLREGGRPRTFKRSQDSDASDDEHAKRATCVKRIAE